MLAWPEVTDLCVELDGLVCIHLDVSDNVRYLIGEKREPLPHSKAPEVVFQA